MAFSFQHFSGLLRSGMTTMICGMIFTMLIARTMSAGMFGLYSSALALAQMCGAMIEFGTSYELTRTSNTPRIGSAFMSALGTMWTLAIASVLLVVMWHSSPFSSNTSYAALMSELLAIVWITLRAIGMSYSALGMVWNRAVLVGNIDALGIILSHGIAAVCVVVFSSSLSDMITPFAFGILVTGEMVKLHILHHCLTQHVEYSTELPDHPFRILLSVLRAPSASCKETWRTIHTQWLLFAVQVLSGIEQRWGIMIGGMGLFGGNYTTVVFFSAPYRLINALRVALGALQKTSLRAFSMAEPMTSTPPHSVWQLFFVVGLGVMMVGALWWYAYDVMALLYGMRYAMLGDILRWQLLLLPALVVGSIAESYVLAHRQERLIVVLLVVEVLALSGFAFLLSRSSALTALTITHIALAGAWFFAGGCTLFAWYRHTQTATDTHT